MPQEGHGGQHGRRDGQPEERGGQHEQRDVQPEERGGQHEQRDGQPEGRGGQHASAEICQGRGHLKIHISLLVYVLYY